VTEMRIAIAMLLLASFGWADGAVAADKFYAYNLTTASDFKGVYLAPAGTKGWGSNQALNDNDKVLNRSERLPLKGLHRGKFDVRLVDQNGHTCIKPDVDLTKELTFEVHDADLTDCH
jgi:hypothetical protein